MENLQNQEIQPVNQQVKKSGISTLIGIIIIVAVSVILFGGVFAYQYFFVKPQPAVQTQNQTNQTAGWKIYTNNKYGFEIKYPDFIEVKEGFCASMCASDDEVGFLDKTNTFLKIETVAAQVKLWDAGNVVGSITLEEFTNGFWEATKNDKNTLIPTLLGEIKETSIGKQKAYIFSSENGIVMPSRSEALEAKTNFLFFSNTDGSKGILSFKDENSKVANQMLSTFKFIPQVPVVNQNPKDSKHISTHIESIDNETICGNMIWPVVRNMSDKNVLNKIEQVLSFRNITGITKQENCAGFTGSDYQINYDKSNVLSISFFTSWMGAYPSEATINYVINLANGEIVKLSDIFYQNKISDLVNLLNTKLQENINKQIDFVAEQNPTGKEGLCSKEDVVNWGLKTGKEYDPNYGKFTEQNLIASNNLNGQTPQYSSLKITSSGIEFIYNFGFAHAIQACEPNGVVVLDYSQLKGYIRLDGLLSNEIK